MSGLSLCSCLRKKVYDVNFGAAHEYRYEDVRSFKINPLYIQRFNEVYVACYTRP